MYRVHQKNALKELIFNNYKLLSHKILPIMFT